MATPINNENQDEFDLNKKTLEVDNKNKMFCYKKRIECIILQTAVRNTAIQMGCWNAIDDYLLITSVLHLCDLERVHKQVKFSMPFSLKNIEDRWRCLLYDVPISK